jgi:hypothetical protein
MLVALFATSAVAQGFGSISGTVADPSGAVIASATITATQISTGRQTTAVSGSNGNYVFPTLPPSAYVMKVSAKGFESYAQTGIVLQADQSLSVNISLTVGSGTETISVSADAPQVDTTTGTLSQVIDQARVEDLPLNGRNAAALITLVAGVSDATNEGNGANQGNGKTFPAAVVTSTNGTLPNQSNYLLDGGNNVDEMTNVNGPFPFPDALQEFSVQTSNYDASFGQSAGAVVNIVTKQGGNKFHGDLFEFARNPMFNARPYFATRVDTLHRNQFGGTIGGPVIIPHFSKGQSTQFFFGYQHTMIHNGSTSNSTTVPTLAEEGRTGTGYADYSNYCGGNVAVTDTNKVKSTYGVGFDGSGNCMYQSLVSGTPATNLVGTAALTNQVLNPFSNQLYPYNHIPTTDFDTAATNLVKVFPNYASTEAAGTIGGAVPYYKATQNTFDEYVSRVDHQFGPNDHLFGRYYYNYFTQPAVYNATNLASYTSYFNTRYQNALIGETHTFTPNLLNNLIINYQREVALRGGPAGSSDVTAFGVNNIWQPNTGPYMAVGVSSYFSVGSSAFAAWGRNNYTFNDDLHWVKGSHNLAFGGHFELSKFDVTNVYTSYGGFTSGTTNQTLTIGGVKSTYYYPNAAANFMMGFLTAFGQGNFEQVNDRNHFPGLYAQDSWKVNHKLTVNYGVRWEMFAPWHNKVGGQTAFSPANYVAGKSTAQFSTLPAGMVLTGDPGFPTDGVNNLYKQFMPRAGFAYDAFGNGKTSIRGGFGMFYQDRLPGFFNLTQASYVPNTISVALSNGGMYNPAAGTNPGGPLSDPYCTTTSSCSAGKYTNPFPFTLPFKSSQAFPNAFQVGEYDPSGNFKVPVTYDYNLTIEQELKAGFALRLAYVGTGSRHQMVNLELNPAVNTGSNLSLNQRRVYNTSPTVGPCTVATGCTTSYSNINEAAMIGSAGFNSMQVTLEKKMSHGLSILANYTWSKSLDDMPQATRVGNTEDINPGESYVYPIYPAGATNIPTAALVSDVKALDRGISDIDHPHVISVSYVYAMPKLHNSFSVVRAIVNDWRTSGLFQHHSGDALTAYMGTDNSYTGLSQDRAQRDFTQDPYLKKFDAGRCPATTGLGTSCYSWLNPAAFSVPSNTGAGTGFGNVVKGTLRGPGYTDWDAALARTFSIFHETKLDFRAEYFNILNHTILGNPTVSNPISSSTAFGTIKGLGHDVREAQFSLKYAF